MTAITVKCANFDDAVLRASATRQLSSETTILR